MASTQPLPSDVHATTVVEQVEKDKEDIPLSKEDDKKTVVEEAPEVPELGAATVTSDDKQPESVIGTEAEKEAPVVDAPVETEVHEVAKTEAEKPATEAVAEAIEDKAEKATSEVVASEPVIEATIENVEAVVEHEEKPTAEAVEDVLVVEAEEKPAAEAVQDPEPQINNLVELVTPEPVTIEGHVEAVVEQEEKLIAEAVEDVPVVEAEHVTQEPVAIKGHAEAVAEQEEKPTAELVEGLEAASSEKNGAEVKEEPTTVTKLAEQATQAVDEVKPEAQTEEEAKNGEDVTVTSSRDMASEEVVVKTKQSGNIMSKVKQSLVKVKKAIIGKSPSSKALSGEAKVEVKAK